MSNNLKDLIDKAEEKEKSRAQLEKTVENLELKVAKLEKKLKKTQSSSKLEFTKPNEEIVESEEITILKNLINSQNLELTQRNREKESLQKKVMDLNTELVTLKESLNDSIKDQVIMKTQNSLNNLIEDYGRLENINKNLKDKIVEFETENDLLRDSAKTLKIDTSNVEQLEYSMSRLKKQLKDLEETNQMLEESNLKLKSKELSVDNLEKTLQNLGSINSELKEENQRLLTKLDTLKAEWFELTKLEAKSSNLEKQVQTLKKENEELRQKDAILLAKTINIMESHSKEPNKIAESPISTESLIEERERMEVVEQTEIIDTIEERLELQKDLITTDILTDADKESKPVEKNLENEMAKEENVTRKKTCPNCGNTNKAYIREFDDKTKIIYTYPRIYAKMYRCGQCGTEWR